MTIINYASLQNINKIHDLQDGAAYIIDNFLFSDALKELKKILPYLDKEMTKIDNKNIAIEQERGHYWIKSALSSEINLAEKNIPLLAKKFLKEILIDLGSKALFSNLIKNIDTHTIDTKKQITFSCRIVCEKYNSFIPMHYDQEFKFMTLILGIGDELSGLPCGTSIFKGINQESVYKGIFYDNRATIIYLPKKVCHGVSYCDLPYPRYTLQLFWFYESDIKTDLRTMRAIRTR